MNVITSVNKPYGLHRSRDEDYFKGEKIASLRKCSIRPTFTYTDFDCYVNRTFMVIKTGRINQKYLTALLNSNLLAFWLKNKGKMQGNNYQIDKTPLLNIPIAKPDENKQKLISALVDEIINLKKQDLSSDTTALEAQIDRMVYELYGLTEEEIKIIKRA